VLFTRTKQFLLFQKKARNHTLCCAACVLFLPMYIRKKICEELFRFTMLFALHTPAVINLLRNPDAGKYPSSGASLPQDDCCRSILPVCNPITKLPANS
jgi:hypothetical protein